MVKTSPEREDFENRLCSNIKRLCKDRKVSVQQVADHLGISYENASHYLRGINVPSVFFLTKLATLFNVSVYDLLGYEDLHLTEDEKQLILDYRESKQE